VDTYSLREAGSEMFMVAVLIGVKDLMIIRLAKTAMTLV
jgi:hypothetical protein